MVLLFCFTQYELVMVNHFFWVIKTRHFIFFFMPEEKLVMIDTLDDFRQNALIPIIVRFKLNLFHYKYILNQIKIPTPITSYCN